MMLFRIVSALALLGAAQAGWAAGPAGSFSIVFVGDIMLDGGPGHIVTNGGDPFAAVAPILRDADLTVGNLECAITRDGHAVDKPYTFKGTRKALPLLKKYFSAVSLANNHSGDWGRRGFADELTLLKETGLPWFGGGANEQEAHQPLVLTANGRRVALLGYNDFPPRSFAARRNSPGTAWLVEKDAVRDIQQARQQADIVILFLHWGEELEDHAAAGAAGARAPIDRCRRGRNYRRSSPRHSDHRLVQGPSGGVQSGQLPVRLFPDRPANLEGLDRQADLRRGYKSQAGEVWSRTRSGRRSALCARPVTRR
jgi:hypothetical protein